MQDWYWAVRRGGPAGDAFVIANGKTALWQRVRAEIDREGRASWNALHKGSPEPNVGHLLQMALVVVPMYRVNHNRFLFEAAQIPCFARFLREGPFSLSECISNSAYPDVHLIPERYSAAAASKFGRIASETLGIEPYEFEQPYRKLADEYDAAQARGEIASGSVHTNNIEGVFGIFKRGMKGVYHDCGEAHLYRYLAEFDFRYNLRTKLGVFDVQRRDDALAGIHGKRLTYRRIGEAAHA